MEKREREREREREDLFHEKRFSMGGKCEIDGQIGYRGRLEYSIERDLAGTKKKGGGYTRLEAARCVACISFSRHGDRKFALSTLRCSIPAVRGSFFVRKNLKSDRYPPLSTVKICHRHCHRSPTKKKKEKKRKEKKKKKKIGTDGDEDLRVPSLDE